MLMNTDRSWRNYETMPARCPQAQPVLLVRHKAGIIQENYDDVSEEEMKIVTIGSVVILSVLLLTGEIDTALLSGIYVVLCGILGK